MKINKIDTLNTNTKRTRNNSRLQKQDLTSFGEAQGGASSPIESKKAAEAIKSKFLSGISFKGHTENIVYGFYGTAGAVAIEENPQTAEYNHFATAYLNINSRLYSYTRNDSDSRTYQKTYYSDAMKMLIGRRPSSHADSSIEETRFKNGYQTDRIYFADPEEVVNEQTKKDHDFIVYDNRPHYPRLEQVRENYKMPGKDAVNYGQNFKTIAEYYVRREKADRKELEKLKGELKAFIPEYEQSVEYKKMLDEKDELFPWEVQDVKADREKSDYYYDLNTKKYNDLNQKIGFYQDRINDSKIQQKKAIQAFRIFDEVGLMMMDRDNAGKELVKRVRYYIPGYESDIANAKQSIAELTERQAAANENLKAAKEWKELQMKNLERAESRIKTLEKSYGWEAENEKNQLTEEVKELNEEINKLNKKIVNIANKLIKIDDAIDYNNKTIVNCKKALENTRAEIPGFQRKFDEKCREIESYWPKMREFYENNIEEWQY